MYFQIWQWDARRSTCFRVSSCERQTWPCRLRDVPHWATVLSPWPVRVLGTLCLMRSVGAHRLTLSNAHWKLIYIFRAISIMPSHWLVFYCDICKVSLKYFFIYGTLNLTFFTLQQRHLVTVACVGRLVKYRESECVWFNVQLDTL